MAKTSIFIPLAAQYDPSEKRFKEMFGLSDIEVRDILVRVYEKVRTLKDADEDDPVTSTDLFMEELQAQKVSPEMTLFFAAYGFQKMFDDSAQGLSLYFYAAKAEKKLREEE